MRAPATPSSTALRAVAVAGLGLLLAGCAADAQRAGTDDAAAAAAAVTWHLRSDVVRPGASPAAQLTRVRSWLTSPDPAEVSAIGSPQWQLLARGGDRIDIAVYAYGRTTAIEGKRGAWGHVCRRYRVDAAGHLVDAPITCPSELPQQPR